MGVKRAGTQVTALVRGREYAWNNLSRLKPEDRNQLRITDSYTQTRQGLAKNLGSTPAEARLNQLHFEHPTDGEKCYEILKSDIRSMAENRSVDLTEFKKIDHKLRKWQEAGNEDKSVKWTNKLINLYNKGHSNEHSLALIRQTSHKKAHNKSWIGQFEKICDVFSKNPEVSIAVAGLGIKIAPTLLTTLVSLYKTISHTNHQIGNKGFDASDKTVFDPNMGDQTSAGLMSRSNSVPSGIIGNGGGPGFNHFGGLLPLALFGGGFGGFGGGADGNPFTFG